jgi:hypothetical protein
MLILLIASERDLKRKQAELERLRAENTRLREETLRFQAESPEHRTQIAESTASPRLEQPAVPLANHSLNQNRRRIRARYVAAVAVLLVLAGASAWFMGRSGDIAAVKGTTAPKPMGAVATPGQQKSQAGITDPAKSADARATTGKPAETKGAAATTLARTAETKSQLVKNESTSTSAAAPSNRAKTADNTAGISPAPRKTALTRSSYQVIRSTRVFSEPNESSRAVALVDAGTEIDVVGVHGQWLEVRSRHGRPPGFIRINNAVKRGPS